MAQDQTPKTTKAIIPDGDLTKSEWWPQIPYGVGSLREDVCAAQSTLMMSAISDVRTRLSSSSNADRLELLVDKLMLQSEKYRALLEAIATKLGIDEDVIRAARPVKLSIRNDLGQTKTGNIRAIPKDVPIGIALTPLEESIISTATKSFADQHAATQSQNWLDDVVHHIEGSTTGELSEDAKRTLIDTLVGMTEPQRIACCVRFSMTGANKDNEEQDDEDEDEDDEEEDDEDETDEDEDEDEDEVVIRRPKRLRSSI
ncbi:MAG: hypothetical protein Q9186_000235 [Xanthomendoza sp. 1 TL-2023]